MNPAQARQAIRHHEAAACRNPRKREQHEKAAAYLREQFGIPPPFNMGQEKNSQAQRAEADRIRKWKESR